MSEIQMCKYGHEAHNGDCIESLRSDLSAARKEIEEAKAHKEIVQLGYEAAIEAAEDRCREAEKRLASYMRTHDALYVDLHRCETKLDAANRAVEELRKYSGHNEDCEINSADLRDENWINCSCGYSKCVRESYALTPHPAPEKGEAHG